MPLITRRWYDIPLRASLVATLVATVVTTSSWVGPKICGIMALFPVVFTSLMLILHPRIGGPPTAAVIANSGWGLMGFGLAIAVIHVAALQFGSAIGLSLALATCIFWNLGLCSGAGEGLRRSEPVIGWAKARSAVLPRVAKVDCFAHLPSSARSRKPLVCHDESHYDFGSFAFSA